jgi:transposase
MANASKLQKLVLTSDEHKFLQEIQGSRTRPLREVQRAQILWRYHAGESILGISRALHVGRDMIYKCLKKALAQGVSMALRDSWHRPKAPVISEEAKVWVIQLACQKPKDLGYAAEIWSRAALALHVRTRAIEAGYPSLKRAAPSTIQRILNQHDLKPHKVTYYLERRDPDFEAKACEVLMVYKQVHDLIEQGPTEEAPNVVTVCVDEKPGVQAIANTAPDLPPRPGRHRTIGRDHEYKRLGTASILAALDLHDGHITARVERKHRSREFILLLKDLDAYYPPGVTIRIILDNHSAHLSKETRAYLETKPNRFKYVLTPKHGSWLNLAETLFGKMARTFLKAIRVKSWNELRDRILLGIAEFNAHPVVHRWKKFEVLSEEKLTI